MYQDQLSTDVFEVFVAVVGRLCRFALVCAFLIFFSLISCCLKLMGEYFNLSPPKIVPYWVGVVDDLFPAKTIRF